VRQLRREVVEHQLRLVGEDEAVQRAVADPEFQAKAVQFFAPLRYPPPAEYEAIVREADGQYRVLWKEMPWADK
jgi:tripartite-type tricarboxylate transporter receptor subunit TctC